MRRAAPPRVSAIAVAFVANGVGAPSFLARLPDRQADLGLSDLGLGTALVGLAAGALVASPVAGHAVGRWGSRSVVVASAVGLGASLWAVGAAPQPALFFAALVVVGGVDAAMDIAMNANGAAYEDRTGRSFMHRLHGAWSLGALVGAGVAAVMASAGVGLTAHLLVVGALIVVGVLATADGLVRGDVLPAGSTGARPGEPAGGGPPAAPGRNPDRGRPRFRWPGALFVLAGAAMAGAVIEGGPSDWSALQLERLGVRAGVSPLGYGAFAAGMLAGRLVGDRLTDAFGGARVLRVGMAASVVGLTLGVATDHPVGFGAGLVLAGAGASGLFPLAFSAAARIPGVAAGTGAATVSLAARIGFLLEPLLMGAVAEAAGLGWAFVLVAVVAALVGLGAGRVIPPATPAVPAPFPDARGP